MNLARHKFEVAHNALYGYKGQYLVRINAFTSPTVQNRWEGWSLNAAVREPYEQVVRELLASKLEIAKVALLAIATSDVPENDDDEHYMFGNHIAEAQGALRKISLLDDPTTQKAEL